MTKGVSALQSPELGAPLRNFKHVHKTSRIFSRDLWSQKFAKNKHKKTKNMGEISKFLSNFAELFHFIGL